MKLCRRTDAMCAAGLEARHVRGTTMVRNLGRRLEALVKSAAAYASRREDHEGHSSSVEAAASS